MKGFPKGKEVHRAEAAALTSRPALVDLGWCWVQGQEVRGKRSRKGFEAGGDFSHKTRCVCICLPAGLILAVSAIETMTL